MHLAHEGPLILELRSTAVRGVGVRRQMHLLFDCGPLPTLFQTTLGTTQMRNSSVGSKATSGMKLPDMNHATLERTPMRLIGEVPSLQFFFSTRTPSCVFLRRDVHGLALASTTHDRCKSGAIVDEPTVHVRGPRLSMAASSTWARKCSARSSRQADCKFAGMTENTAIFVLEMETARHTPILGPCSLPSWPSLATMSAWSGHGLASA